MTGLAKCANRGCREPVATSGSRPMTKCIQCLVSPRQAKWDAQAEALRALPPLVIPAGAMGFRLQGSPVGVNRAFMPRRGKIIHTPIAREWKRAVALAALASRPRGWDQTGPMAVEIHSVFVSPLADVDGPVKLVQDALQGVAYVVDRQVQRTTATKGQPDGVPRLEVIVKRLPPLPSGHP